MPIDPLYVQRMDSSPVVVQQALWNVMMTIEQPLLRANVCIEYLFGSTGGAVFHPLRPHRQFSWQSSQFFRPIDARAACSASAEPDGREEWTAAAIPRSEVGDWKTPGARGGCTRFGQLKSANLTSPLRLTPPRLPSDRSRHFAQSSPCNKSGLYALTIWAA